MMCFSDCGLQVGKWKPPMTSVMGARYVHYPFSYFPFPLSHELTLGVGFVLEKFVEEENKDEGGEKGEEGVDGSASPCVFPSSHMKFGFDSTLVQEADLNTHIEGKEGISIDQSNMYKCMKEG
ncbi:hypothetical protein LR48_Vigan04g093600 [Vigna angularis]|uniref:Uncharacterized protein n=1 Tax=Phaseolus angularis TaxID=3914 RepID=A0A0L9UDA5_PHAAN|nr:hypothetical protein LR48_Vigan04g093600 [Vigna angularis]